MLPETGVKKHWVWLPLEGMRKVSGGKPQKMIISTGKQGQMESQGEVSKQSMSATGRSVEIRRSLMFSFSPLSFRFQEPMGAMWCGRMRAANCKKEEKLVQRSNSTGLHFLHGVSMFFLCMWVQSGSSGFLP